MKKKAVLLLVAGLLLLTGCSVNPSADTGKGGKITVAVTIIPEKTFVQAVCGDLVNIVSMVPPGSSPENYEPTAAQMEDFSNASVYFAIGMPIEDTYILPRAGDITGMKTVKLQDEVSAVYPDRELAPGERDPHIWLSPKRAKVMVAVIAREMGSLDAANKETYNANAKKYMAELDALDSEIKTTLAGVKNKKFIVFHPAFGYLADDYGLTMYALEEEGKEATPQHMQGMIDLAKREGIKAIFYQEEIDSRQSQSFAEELGGKTVQLEPLAADYIANLKKMAATIAEVMQ
ncbi:MAG: metal ABC transporter solute-binding protein, Zn/Mn family [Bacillota bacterium]